jgi:hypothetical protein
MYNNIFLSEKNKMSKKTRGIHEIYAENAEKADWLVWGRKADPISRRGFITKSSLLAMTAIVGASIPFAKYIALIEEW